MKTPTFAVAFCNHVMEHVDDDIKAMSELHRVLKPG
ncbi:methyltransferase domain-containing protein, partial [Runella sp. CRIBMP]